MDESARDLLAAFDSFPPAIQQEIAKEILRRTTAGLAVEDLKLEELQSSVPAPVRSARRSLFSRSIGPMIWVAGLALIIYLAPAGYRALRLPDHDYTCGFLGTAHELVVTSGITTLKEVLPSVKGKGVRSAEAQIRLAEVASYRALRTGAKPVSIYLLNVESGFKRKVDLDILKGPMAGVHQVSSVTPCLEANRLCLESELGQLAIVDARNGESLLELDGVYPGLNGLHPWSIDPRGNRLACLMRGDVKCLDVHSGRDLYKYDGPSFFGILSGRSTPDEVLLAPNGKYVAMHMRHEKTEVIDISRQPPKEQLQLLANQGQDRLLTGTKNIFGQPEIAESFSPDGTRFIDRRGHVWDVQSATEICTASGPCIFADDGKKLVWLEPAQGGMKIVWYDIESRRELTDRPMWISQNVTTIANIDAQGNLIRVDGNHEPPERTWFEKALDRVGLKMNPKAQHRWLLIDGRTRAIIAGGDDDLLTVSRDGYYAVTTDEDEARLKVYELPLRRSMLFMTMAGSLWTMFAAIVWRWRRRRAFVHLQVS